MARRSWFATLALVLLLLLAVATTVKADGYEVTGFYRVTQVTDLGPQVRVSLHIRLLNNTSQNVSITHLSLHDLHAQGRPSPVPGWTTLQPRQVTTVEQQFVISKWEYQSWSKGARPMLQVALQSAGAHEVARAIPLRRLPPQRPQ